ncbi:hypothetical protein BX666DRAFT_2028411 [Dichotomocladium elegans]|nr:hypothetical protein BX666DRAFT_2028411 [Dichotomocladium elegans]
MSFFASGLAMWSPPTAAALAVNNRTVPTTTGTPTATSAGDTLDDVSHTGDDLHQDPIFWRGLYYHQPVYEPRTCLICGLFHEDTAPLTCDSKVLSYFINDPSTVSAALPEEQSQQTMASAKDDRIVVLQKRPQGNNWWKACVLHLRHLWMKLIHQKRQHIHPTSRKRYPLIY